MKNSFHQVLAILGTSLFFLLNAVGTALAQVPQGIPYQAIARNASGVAIANTVVKVRFSIRDSIATGPVRYQETHTPTTSALGLFSVNVGAGTVVSGTFSGINWGKNAKFMQVELDPAGGNTFTNLGTTQMMSVPYALNSGNGVANGTANNQIMYWNGTAWTQLNPGSNGQTLTICNGVLTWTTGGICQSNLPSLSTSAVSAVTTSTASSGGNITSDGGGSITARGVCWSTSQNPTVTLSTKTSNGTGSGSFTSTLSGLNPGTTYYVRAYATNSAGTAYGNQIVFTTSLVSLATITTTEINSITALSGKSGGSLIDYGGSSIISKGVCWSTNPNPTIALSTKTIDGTGSSSFSSTMNGLTAETVYYVRAYATNGSGTAYGNQLVFSTNNLLYLNGNGVVDIDGNNYQTVVLGSQEWMRENLKTTRYKNGVSLLSNLNNTQWASCAGGGNCYGAYAWYNNDTTYNNVFGKLYNWCAVADSRGLCPVGWHIPSEADWTTLSVFLNGVNVAGGKLKATGTLEGGNGIWKAPNTLASNISNFYALPGGFRNASGLFFTLFENAFYWTSSLNALSQPYERHLFFGSGELMWGNDSKTSGLSVRCLKD
jgi:uncharacterized protein (TIGR02145 family)